MTWTCWNCFQPFLTTRGSSFVQSTAVWSATFRRDVLFQLLNPYHVISAVTALQAAAQLEVVCPILCVLREEHLSIDRPVSPGISWPEGSRCCCWIRLLLCCSTSSHHITTERLLVGGIGGPGRPTVWRVGVRLARLVRHHRPHRHRSV